MRFKHLDRSNKGYLEKSDLLVLKEVSEEKSLIRCLNFLDPLQSKSGHKHTEHSLAFTKLFNPHIADPHEPSRRPHRGQHVRHGRPRRQTLLQGVRPPFRPLPALQPQHKAEPHQLQARTQVTVYRIAMDMDVICHLYNAMSFNNWPLTHMHVGLQRFATSSPSRTGAATGTSARMISWSSSTASWAQLSGAFFRLAQLSVLAMTDL